LVSSTQPLSARLMSLCAPIAGMRKLNSAARVRESGLSSGKVGKPVIL
jgi:hypothetical protein